MPACIRTRPASLTLDGRASGETARFIEFLAFIAVVVYKSGRQDLNLRPHGPEPCALSRLSYAPQLHASIDLSDLDGSVNSIHLADHHAEFAESEPSVSRPGSKSTFFG